ncbi:glucose 1-dehydrogenase [Thauera sinica]|uniref:Glucose 1-dehydrogenase n=1 Tax=Thauera sinica TaxID=2665146 RepID=A0ABW1AXW9_9RHOO|nr:glucose 1-dehydrogenase [Thauera sp. K11]ATE61240.1 3-beta hydroxysteroid dehydrogenase [Thauera sp. K11]
MKRVEGKIALVTGAANGLGRATAAVLAREGALVLLTDIDDAGGEAAAEGIRAAGGKARYCHHDASSPDDWASVLARLDEAHGRLDILVNNAGGGTYNDIETVSLEQWRRIMAINLDATFIGTQSAIRWMKNTGGGNIINVSSVAAFSAAPNLAAYCAAKAGINMLSKSAAVYCGQKGYNIRINVVHPGLIETRSGVEMARLATGAARDEDAIAMFTALHPIGRIGQPDDIANGILYLASDESRFVTASSLIIDGGFTAV